MKKVTEPKVTPLVKGTEFNAKQMQANTGELLCHVLE